MKLLIDTSLPKMLLVLFQDTKVLFHFLSDEKKKADILPKIFQKMLTDKNIKTSDINEFYVTIGPGSFMGSRTALTFIRTICQITNAKFFVAKTLDFIGAKSNTKIFVDAKSDQSYMFDPKTKQTSIVNYEQDTTINYDDIIQNIQDYLINFKEKDPNYEKAFYLKNPRIGGK